MTICTARYIGRLGNNMFQLAAAIGYANRYKCRWASVPNNEEVPDFYNYFPNLPRFRAPNSSYQCHDPKTFNYKPIKFQGSVNLMGFFQSEKYFEHCKDEVKEVFKLPVTEGMQDYTSIHVRRGDYIKYKESFPPVTLNYIRSAITEMKIRGHKKFMFFSDDINWCRQNFSGVEFSTGKNPFEDMALMASCGNHIISNSTYSWWGAYLGVNPDRHIISPSHKSWFGRGNGVVMAIGAPKDIIPEGWQQIDF
jgi:hypothetical protein